MIGARIRSASRTIPAAAALVLVGAMLAGWDEGVLWVVLVALPGVALCALRFPRAPFDALGLGAGFALVAFHWEGWPIELVSPARPRASALIALLIGLHVFLGWAVTTWLLQHGLRLLPPRPLHLHAVLRSQVSPEALLAAATPRPGARGGNRYFRADANGNMGWEFAIPLSPAALRGASYMEVPPRIETVELARGPEKACWIDGGSVRVVWRDEEAVVVETRGPRQGEPTLSTYRVLPEGTGSRIEMEERIPAIRWNQRLSVWLTRGEERWLRGIVADAEGRRGGDPFEAVPEDGLSLRWSNLVSRLMSVRRRRLALPEPEDLPERSA